MSTDEPTPATEQQPQPSERRHRSNWTFGRVVAMVLASLAGLLGLCLLLGGAAIVIAHGVIRDDDGFYQSGEERLTSDAYAISTDEIDLDIGPTDWAGEDLLGDLRLTIEGAADDEIFIGIGPTVEVTRYLDGVRHDVLADFDGNDAQLETVAGNRRPQPPGRQDFWEARASGSGEQELDWDVESGVWSIVVMNADASPGVDVEAEVGVKLGWVIWVGLGLLVVGLILTAAAVIAIIAVSRRAARDPAPA
jgi:hypothetical protein